MLTVRYYVIELQCSWRVKGHAVVVVAEGYGQSVFPKALEETDTGGNQKLPAIGVCVSCPICYAFTFTYIALVYDSYVLQMCSIYNTNTSML